MGHLAVWLLPGPLSCLREPYRPGLWRWGTCTSAEQGTWGSGAEHFLNALPVPFHRRDSACLSLSWALVEFSKWGTLATAWLVFVLSVPMRLPSQLRYLPQVMRCLPDRTTHMLYTLVFVFLCSFRTTRFQVFSPRYLGPPIRPHTLWQASSQENLVL